MRGDLADTWDTVVWIMMMTGLILVAMRWARWVIVMIDAEQAHGGSHGIYPGGHWNDSN